MNTPTNVIPPAAARTDGPVHTPVPWQVSSSTIIIATDDARALALICNTMDLAGVSEIGIREASANAAFIVEAVNNHQRLTDELEIRTRQRDHWQADRQQLLAAHAAHLARIERLEKSLAECAERLEQVADMLGTKSPLAQEARALLSPAAPKEERT